MSPMDCDKCDGRGYMLNNFTLYTMRGGRSSDYYDSTNIPYDGYIVNIVCPKCCGSGKIRVDGSKREPCLERSVK